MLCTGTTLLPLPSAARLRMRLMWRLHTASQLRVGLPPDLWSVQGAVILYKG